MPRWAVTDILQAELMVAFESESLEKLVYVQTGEWRQWGGVLLTGEQLTFS